ncbi:NAD-dependent deacylase [Bdellovibrio sp. HCB337]|uniref:NAD-dependent deacylase n=1 Tax=Bdellovibrio sp. HCB337 TaxID=3394358 RepID=UPI0039A69634
MKKNIVILTGAGISAESGLKTFRDNNGLWENHRVEDVATPEAFARNPELVHRFYNLRRLQLNEVEPNAAHKALAELEKAWQGDFLLVSQNVDDLHKRAGSKKLLNMHGQLRSIWCTSCDAKMNWENELTQTNECPRCRVKGDLRPDIVWFGEMPYYMDEIYEALNFCDYFVAIGTSGNVYPAAGFVQMCPQAHKIEINKDASLVSSYFDEQWIGPASEQVPTWARKILNS